MSQVTVTIKDRDLLPYKYNALPDTFEAFLNNPGNDEVFLLVYEGKQYILTKSEASYEPANEFGSNSTSTL